LIYYDPTESRAGSRLPDSLLRAGKPLIGLEAYTAADLLLSTANIELDSIDDTRLSQIKLDKLLEQGMLVQRKTGRDVTHFITDHAQIIAKMHPWCKRVAPWLLLIGSFACDRDGRLVVDGQALHWDYNAYLAALDAWQYQGIASGLFDGGGISILPRDNLAGQWATRWLDKLRNMAETKELAPFKPSQTVTVKSAGEDYPWRSTLMTFPGIGLDIATRIAKYCGTLANALMFLSNPEHIMLKGCEGYPEGMGPSRFSDAHQWLGLEIGDTELEELVTVLSSRFTGKKAHYNAPPWKGP